MRRFRHNSDPPPISTLKKQIPIRNEFMETLNVALEHAEKTDKVKAPADVSKGTLAYTERGRA